MMYSINTLVSLCLTTAFVAMLSTNGHSQQYLCPLNWNSSLDYCDGIFNQSNYCSARSICRYYSSNLATNTNAASYGGNSEFWIFDSNHVASHACNNSNLNSSSCPFLATSKTVSLASCNQSKNYICRKQTAASGIINNKQLSASSFFKSETEPKGYRAEYSGLGINYIPGTDSQNGWCSSTASHGEYLEIDFNKFVLLTKLAVQGVEGRRCDFWTTSFNLTYKAGSDIWMSYSPSGTNGSINANDNAVDTAAINFSSPMIVRKIRIYPIGFGTDCVGGKGRFCIKVEAYGIDISASTEVKLKNNITRSLERYNHNTTLAAHYHKNQISWPSGKYALPKPKSGCPSSLGANWNNGYRLQDNRMYVNSNMSSTKTVNHLQNTISTAFFVEEFCSKSSELKDDGGSFPPGNYCIYQIGETCPHGFQNGSLKFFEDETIGNRTWSHSYGVAPKSRHNYDSSTADCCFTELYYCCRNDGASTYLKLPAGMPFYLLPTTNSCPNTTDARTSIEYFDLSLGTKQRTLNEVGSGLHPHTTLSVKQNGSTSIYVMRNHLCYYEPQATTNGSLMLDWQEEIVNANYELGAKIALFTGNNLIRYGDDSNLRIDVLIDAACSLEAAPAFCELSKGAATYNGAILTNRQCGNSSNLTITFTATTYSGQQINVTKQASVVSKTNIFVFISKANFDALPELDNEIKSLIEQHRRDNERVSRQVKVTIHAFEGAKDVQDALRGIVNKSKTDPDSAHGIIAINSQNVQDILNSVINVNSIPFVTGKTNAVDLRIRRNNTLQFTLKINDSFANFFRRLKSRNISEFILIRSKTHEIPISFAYYLTMYKMNIHKDIALADDTSYDIVKEEITILRSRRVPVYFIVEAPIASTLLIAATKLAVSPMDGYVWISGLHNGVFDDAVGSKECYRLTPMTCSEAFRGVMMFHSVDHATGLNAYIDGKKNMLNGDSLNNDSSTVNLKLLKNMIIDGTDSLIKSVYSLTAANQSINARKITELAAATELKRLKSLQLASTATPIGHEKIISRCAQGWTGSNCTQPLCSTNPCETGKGKCVANSICECHPGQFGFHCAGNCVDRCQHGVCNDGRLGDGSCVTCDWLYSGVYCDEATVLKALIASCLGLLVVVLIATCYILKICRPKQHSTVGIEKDEANWIFDWDDLKEVEKVSLDKTLDSRHLAEKMRYTDYFKAKLQDKNAFVTCIKKKPVKLSLDVRLEIRKITQLDHINIEKVMGVCLGPPYVAIVTALASMGSLYDTLHAENVDVPLEIKYTFMEDVCRGMLFLHEKCGIAHGRLKSTNCLLHKGWRVKVTDIGLPSLRKRSNNKLVYQVNRLSQDDSSTQKPNPQFADYNSLLWTAPEYLGSEISNIDQIDTVHFGGDVYSFGILMAEILTRVPPYEEIKVMSTQHIIEAIAHLREPMVDLEVIRPGTSKAKKEIFMKSGAKVLRPKLKDDSLPKEEPSRSILRLLMESAWSDDPGDRPPFAHVKNVLKIIVPLKGDQIAKRAFLLEKETEMLEKYIAHDTKMIVKEREKVDDWFKRILPPEISQTYAAGENTEPRQYENVSVAAFQIVDFHQIVEKSQPSQLISLVDYLLKMFYATAKNQSFEISEFGLLSGTNVIVAVDDSTTDNHADHLVQFCLQILKSLKKMVITYKNGLRLNLKAALHSGRAVGGFVFDYGQTPRYRIFGETVNLAVKLCGRSEPHCLLLTETCAKRVRNRSRIRLVPMSDSISKSYTNLQMYWVAAKK